MNLINTFENTFNSEDTYETISQIGDVTIDAIFDNELFNNIPLFNLLYGCYKTTKDIQQYFLMKKIYKFLFKIKDITEKERREFIKEYTNKNKEQGCEALLILMDRLDNINKVDILSNILKAKIQNQITIENFIRVCTIIERLPFSDFCELEKYLNDYYEEGSTDILLSAGVLFNTIIDSEKGNRYQLNSLGEIILKYGLKQEVHIQKSNYTHLKDLEFLPL